MAGRKDKNIVDYFPHYCVTGKTMFIIESKFGHLGYAIWFKTLELLGQSENHYIDLRDDTDLLFLISKLKITEDEFKSIYNLLSKLGAIDAYLWSKKIVFSDNFIKNIDDAYSRRKNKCMHKCDLCMHLFKTCSSKCGNSEHKYAKESRVKESKEKESIEFSVFWNMYDKKRGDKEACKNKWEKLSLDTQETIIKIIPNYIASISEKQYQPYPATFLNKKLWNDEIPTGSKWNNISELEMMSLNGNEKTELYNHLVTVPRASRTQVQQGFIDQNK